MDWIILLMIIGGLASLVIAAEILVRGASRLAAALGISPLIIGLTVVAFGTSSHELAVSVQAAYNGSSVIGIGYVVGSNIFNILAVLGVSAVAAPNGIAVAGTTLRFDIPVMIAVAVATLPILFTGNLISRWEGGLFIVYLAAYLAYLIFDSIQHHDNRDMLANTMFWFVIPFTIITITITVVQELRVLRSRQG